MTPARPGAGLAGHRVSEVGDAVGLHHPRTLQAVPVALGEHPDAAAEQDRDDVQVNLVQEPRSQVLLRNFITPLSR